MLARFIIGLAFLGVACGASAEPDEGAASAEAVTSGTAAIDTAGHDTQETAIVVPEIDDSITTTERRDITFSLPAGKTAFFRVHYRDTWAFNGVLNPANFGLRIDVNESDPYIKKVAIDFTCDGNKGGRAECGCGLYNGSWECDWYPDPLGNDHSPLITMSKMSCNTITNSSGWFTIRVEREAAAPGASATNGLATLRVRNALDSLNDPAVDQDAPR